MIPLCGDDECPSHARCWRYMLTFYSEGGQQIWTDYERDPAEPRCDAFWGFEDAPSPSRKRDLCTAANGGKM